MKKVALIFVSLVLMIYPLVVFWGIEESGPRLLALLLLFVGIIRFLLAPARSGFAQYMLLVIIFGYSAIVVVSNSEILLRVYPVIMSLSVAVAFAVSLIENESLIERIARSAGKTITPRARQYTRRLTGLWAIVLLINAVVSLYLALYASIKTWALYCGLLSYMILAGFFLAELGYRQYYIKKYGA